MTHSEAKRAGLAFYVQRGPYDTYCPTPVGPAPGWNFGDCGSFYRYADAVRACAVLNDKAKALA
jgi:hypothetical protein